jgi:hypothetical protein
VSSLPSFHTKAVEQTQARTESAKGERDKASQFLSELDMILSEGFAEVSDLY